jgi:hypothetical protein
MHYLAKVSYLVTLFRKIATISLFTFLFFNWVGYWLFISWFETRETDRFVARLDKQQYNADQLIVLKVSADGIPYSTASATFERADGEIEVGNIHYRYVCKRLYNDSVEFLCLPDPGTSRLHRVKNDLLRLTTDVPGKQSNSRGKTAQLLLKVFWQDIAAISINHFSDPPVPGDISRESALCQGHTRIGKQPPRMIPS